MRHGTDMTTEHIVDFFKTFKKQGRGQQPRPENSPLNL